MPRDLYRKWTPEEKETLTRLYNEGRSFPEIAAAVGRPRNATATMCRAMGLNRDGVPPAEIKAILKEAARLYYAANRERLNDYTREYQWERRSRLSSLSNPGVTP